MDPPDGLQPKRIPAWEALAAGGTYADAATASNVSKGTISKWLRAWRDDYGDDLFRGQQAAARTEATEAAREAAQQMWGDLRLQEARNLGVTASQIRARILDILPSVGTRRVDRSPDGAHPVVVTGPNAIEIKYLTDSVAKLLETAELLDGRPTRHHMRSVPSDQYDPGAGEESGEVSRGEIEGRVIILADRLAKKPAANQ